MISTHHVLSGLILLAVISPVIAQPQVIFTDDFELSIPARWSGWQDVTDPPSTYGPQMLFNEGSHFYDGALAARQEKAQPYWYGSLHEELSLLNAVNDTVRVSVWQFEDFNKQEPFPPENWEAGPHDQVQGWLALMDATELEFFAIGVHAHVFSPEPLTEWWGHISWATTYDGWHTTTVPRAQGWRKLEIAVHPYSGNIGDVEFFVDGVKVGEGHRLPSSNCDGMAVTRVGLGASPAHVPEDDIANTYEFFWYDALELTTEPAGSGCPNAEVRFDGDNDGDVDQEDFSMFQLCSSGDGDPSLTYDCTCHCWDSDADNDVDGGDFLAFQACASGPGVPADFACDDGL